MKEKKMVKQELEEYRNERDADLAQWEAVLEAKLNILIDVLQTLDSRPFQISSNMVRVLHKILTVEDVSDLRAFNLGDLGFTAVSELHSLATNQNQEVCRKVMLEIHKRFSGHCIDLAAGNSLYHDHKFLQFSKKNPNATPEELKPLEDAKTAAANGLNQTFEFCSRYSLRS